MPYTLTMGLVWFLLALLLGIVIGWLLRSIVAKRQVMRARSHHVDTVEMERLRGRVANLEPAVAERDRLRAELAALSAGAGTGGKQRTPASESAPAASVTESGVPIAPDLAEAASVLGKPIVHDDLRLIEGIGPKIEGLCNGIGIRTWHDLATTEVSLLRTMLADAGPRFRTHDPATWPQQAQLLSEGRWTEFRDLVASTGASPEPSDDE